MFVGNELTPATVKSSVSEIIKFDEKVNYQTIVYDKYKTDLYSLSAINIAGNEYVTSWVINKALHKLIYNHLLFRDNFHSKYIALYDGNGRVQYTGVNYIKDVDTNLFEYSTSLNNFIGLNEPVLAETINRPLKEIYNMQLKLIDMCKERYTNKYPHPTQIVGLQ